LGRRTLVESWTKSRIQAGKAGLRRGQVESHTSCSQKRHPPWPLTPTLLGWFQRNPKASTTSCPCRWRSSVPHAQAPGGASPWPGACTGGAAGHAALPPRSGEYFGFRTGLDGFCFQRSFCQQPWELHLLWGTHRLHHIVLQQECFAALRKPAGAEPYLTMSSARLGGHNPAWSLDRSAQIKSYLPCCSWY
jgi:hypothetical protein